MLSEPRLRPVVILSLHFLRRFFVHPFSTRWFLPRSPFVFVSNLHLTEQLPQTVNSAPALDRPFLARPGCSSILGLLDPEHLQQRIVQDIDVVVDEGTLVRAAALAHEADEGE